MTSISHSQLLEIKLHSSLPGRNRLVLKWYYSFALRGCDDRWLLPADTPRRDGLRSTPLLATKCGTRSLPKLKSIHFDQPFLSLLPWLAHNRPFRMEIRIRW